MKKSTMKCIFGCFAVIFVIVLLWMAMLLGVFTFLIGGPTTTIPTTTPPTTTPTTTLPPTTPTTTVPPEPPEDNLYKIMFSFVWGDSIAEDDKCWMEFAVYNYHDITVDGKRDQVTLGAGHGDTGDWFDGAWGETFTEGEEVSVAIESFSDWYDFELVEYVDVTVGPWTNFFTFHSYKYGFSVMLTGQLRVSWGLL